MNKKNNLPAKIQQLPLVRVEKLLSFTNRLIAKSDQKYVDFFLDHPKAFNRILSKYYNFNKLLLIEYQNILDWEYVGLSNNTNIKWTIEIIELFFDILDWSSFKRNKGIVWSKELIIKYSEKFKDTWNNDNFFFYNLSSSEDLPWSVEFIKSLKEHWNWKELCRNKAIVWDDNLITLFENEIDWISLSGNNEINWTEELIEKYKNKLFWDVSLVFDMTDECPFVFAGLCANNKLPWSIPFIEKYKERFTWENHGHYCDMTSPYNIANNSGIPWSFELITQFKNYLDWSVLSSNEHIPWSLNLLEEYKIRWNWSNLSKNINVCWSYDLIQKYSAKWNWEYLSKNPSLPWSMVLIEKYKDKLFWDKYHLSSNSGLCLSIQLIEKFIDYWDWNALSYNQSETWSNEIIYKFEDKWNWGRFNYNDFTKGLSENEKLQWNEELIDKYYHKWNWDSLSSNKGIVWNFVLIEKYKDNISWNHIANLDYLDWSFELVNEYIDYLKYYLHEESLWLKVFKKIIDDCLINNVFNKYKNLVFIKENIKNIAKKNDWLNLKYITDLSQNFFKDNEFVFYYNAVSIVHDNICNNEDLKKAIINFEKCIDLNYKPIKSLYFIGLCHFKLKNYQKAIEYFNKYTELEYNEYFGLTVPLFSVKQCH